MSRSADVYQLQLGCPDSEIPSGSVSVAVSVSSTQGVAASKLTDPGSSSLVTSMVTTAVAKPPLPSEAVTVTVWLLLVS